MKTFELINAHGPDHGLSVAVCFYSSRAEVRIRQWAECCEPDERGSYSKHIQEATVDLTDLLDSDGKHFSCGYVESESMHGRIVSLACNWLSYWGGDEEHVDDDDDPCDHFLTNYSGIGAKRIEPWPGHMVCSTCGGEPE